MTAESPARAAASRILHDHWREPGFTCPNSSTYPWLWLWDSCFHSIVWAELGDADRAVSELTTALSYQDADGFVPHLLYLDGSNAGEALWGRRSTSSITQPPIYGHTIAELRRRGIAVPPEVVDAATAGLLHLLEQRRRTTGGLVELVHPWESGCDHSPRWDDLMAPGHLSADPFDEQQWFRRKGELLETVQRSSTGAPLHNDQFAVGSVAFSALIVFCALELAGVTDDRELRTLAEELRDAVQYRWEPGRRTWIDDGPTESGSGRVRTAEALLALLVDQRSEVVDAVVAELTDASAFNGPFGLSQVHHDEPTYSAGSYWRGPSWPQLDYLLWLALGRAGRTEVAAELAATVVAGAQRAGWAEYWDADTGVGGGATPQSWTTLVICMDQRRDGSR